MMFFKKKEKKLAIIECASNNIYQDIKFPYSIGFGSDCDLNITSDSNFSNEKIKFSLSNTDLCVVLYGDKSKIFIDSVPLSASGILKEDVLHTLQLNDSLFFFYYGKDAQAQISRLNLSNWNIVDTVKNQEIASGISFFQLRDILSNEQEKEDVAFFPSGLNIGFWAKNIPNQTNQTRKVIIDKIDEPIVESFQQIDEECGALTCPSCWLKFNTEDVNFVAVHASLRGDPLLGEDEQLRFVPTKYNAKGVPLDPMGVPAHAMACPHCHRRLPSTFLQMKGHIISLVGAPSSGKSYFLSILLHFLPKILFKYYKTAFIDADPPLNAVITAMKNKLFAVSNSQDHFLSKTQLEGAMYDRLVRHGKKVSLPKPFVYVLRDMKDFSNQSSLTFYDNAGEHFEPGISIEDSPGSLHVAFADILMFLFDPLVSTNIKLKLNKDIDPQLLSDSIDQQDIILAEMANRIKQIKNIDNAYDLNIPFTFVVNKSDAIFDLFDAKKELEYPIKEGALDYDIIDRNSAKIKDFLFEYAPNIVINAEMVSKNIKYFMISSFGHSPKVYQKEDMSKYIMPDPALITPMQIEVPLIWALSQISSVSLYRDLNKNLENSKYIF